VNGHLQYDLAHASPAVPSRGRNPIELAVGFDEGGVSADYRVHIEPKPSKAWIDVVDVDDLAVSTTKR
jgi:hypothetical protein